MGLGEVAYFSKICYLASYQDSYQVVLMLLIPHKFLCLLCYYWVLAIKMYEVVVASSDITFILNFMKIGQFKFERGNHMHKQHGNLMNLLFILKKGK